MIVPAFALPILAGTGLYAAWSDALYRRLSNRLALLTCLGGLILAAGTGGPAAVGSSLLHAATVMVIGLLLFARGLVGGGDVKYYAAVATWFPLGQGFRLLACVSLAGLVLTLGWLVWHRWVRTGAAEARTDPAIVPAPKADQVPFGIAIASGAFLAALGSAA